MSKQVQEAYIVAAVRTPVAKARGVFRHVRPDDMLVHVLKGLLDTVPSLAASAIADVIIGCAMPEAEQGMNVARIATLLADLPQSVPAMTINRFCSSGVQTVAMAADKVMLGEADVVIAGGTESMTMIPMGGHHFVANPAYFADDEAHAALAYSMGITAEKVAKKWEVTREQQDQFAVESHQKALKAIEDKVFVDEILPYTVTEDLPNLAAGTINHKSFTVEQDTGPRAGTSIDVLAKLRPVFAARGSVTAGNTSQMSDGAAAVLVVSEKALKDYGLTPLAKFRAFSVAGVAPEHMGIGPVAAIPKALSAAGLQQSDLDWIELNEAFAAQSLAVIKDLKLNPAKVNPRGGAIALGHPLGATGAIRTTMCLNGLRQTKGRYGMVTMCIGTGMGAAGIFEVL